MEQAENGAGKPVKKILISFVITLLLVGGAGAAYMHFKPSHAKVAIPKQAFYISLEPSFVVNLADVDASRFLQVDVQVLSREESAVNLVKQHSPQIRDKILSYLATQKTSTLSTSTGKDDLRQVLLSAIQGVLSKETGKPLVEELYFTSFVMQ